MRITINDNRKIYALQDEFHKAFPYLKIEFYAKPHKRGGYASSKMIKHPSKTLGECRTVHAEGTIEITPHITVAELEQSFSDVFGLAVQVFRKSGNAWLETSVTDDWSLEQQNKEGEELSIQKQS